VARNSLQYCEIHSKFYFQFCLQCEDEITFEEIVEVLSFHYENPNHPPQYFKEYINSKISYLDKEYK
jgi:hypothetical protein